eukprot:TRINITY_DN9495_c0_g1_i1.p1 TRINITY_DN9495_c0_g1~~TRINITY_DN9495_c0_g1_i1.p1  ORF type:complete len:128 (+),score=11.33 TRINITY_DN9495_c0_g1_i1:93-476(+)
MCIRDRSNHNLPIKDDSRKKTESPEKSTGGVFHYEDEFILDVKKRSAPIVQNSIIEEAELEETQVGIGMTSMRLNVIDISNVDHANDRNKPRTNLPAIKKSSKADVKAGEKRSKSATKALMGMGYYY